MTIRVFEPNKDTDIELMIRIQERMMSTDDEWGYDVLKRELFDKFGTSRVCTRCKSQVLLSDLPNYDYLCFECDENLYDFETENVHSNSREYREW